MKFKLRFMSKKIYFIDRYDIVKKDNIKEYSGYEQIVKYSPLFTRIKANKFLSRTFKIKLPKNYIRANLFKEIKALFISVFTGSSIFYLYADKDAFLLPLIKKKFGLKRIKIFGTLHWPVEISESFSFYKHNLSEQFNGVITLSNSLTKLPVKNIKVIPHGIDLDFWQNSNSYAEDGYYLLLGESNRNHQEQVNFIKTIYEVDNNSKFILLSRKKEIYNQYENLPNISIIKNRITDIELKQLYSEAKAVILIQYNCLASNVVLESIAMNIPLIINRVGDIEEYLGVEYPLFTDTEVNVYKFINDNNYNKRIRQYIDSIKWNFSWKQIAEKTVKFIEN